MVLFTEITIALFYLNLLCKNTIQQLFSFVKFKNMVTKEGLLIGPQGTPEGQPAVPP